MIKDFTYTLKKGKFYLIKGHNGAGKSTLIKLALGLYNPDSEIDMVGEHMICDIMDMFPDDMYDEWSSDDFQNERIELCKNAENVIIVEPLDELRCYGMNMLQKVQVKECIKGNIEKDSIIWINKSGGPSRESVPHEYDNDALVYILNFSDVMRTDMEYIAMLNSEQTIAEYLDIPIYNGADSIFTYFAINNTNIAVEKDIEDIKLSELKNCDIFAQSQKTLDCIEQIKYAVLTEYGITDAITR